MPALPQPEAMAEVLGAAHPRRAQTYSISLSGTLDGTGTRWRASYRWQPEDTVTEVAPFALDAAAPYLNLQLRQPIQLSRDGSERFGGAARCPEHAGRGLPPHLLSDGSLLVFAQDQRSIRGGLALPFIPIALSFSFLHDLFLANPCPQHRLRRCVSVRSVSLSCAAAARESKVGVKFAYCKFGDEVVLPA